MFTSLFKKLILTTLQFCLRFNKHVYLPFVYENSAMFEHLKLWKVSQELINTINLLDVHN